MSRSETASRDGASRSRTLGLWPATALVVGHTIAVGIFLTPAQLIGSLASPVLTLTLWVVCGALVFAGALTFGELAARYPQAGGLYVYLREGWGERLAFLYGWQSLLVMDPGVTAALAAGLSEYAVVLWPAGRGHERAIALGVVWLLAVCAMAGLSFTTRALGALTAVKVLALVAVVATAFASGHGQWSHFATPAAAPRTMPIAAALASALVGAFFSFGGFWEASRIAGEIDRPAVTLPRALALGVAAVTLVYVVTTCAFIYLVPADAVTSSAEFARRAGEAMIGSRGPAVLAAVVLLSVTVSMLALLVMAPRLYVAMAEDGLFPRALASIQPMTGAPVRATGLMAILASGFVLIGTFQEIVAFFICTALVFVALAAAALFIVRRRRTGAAVFSVPGYPIVPALFILLVGCVTLLIAINQPWQAAAGCVLMLVGLPVHTVLKARGGLRSHVEEGRRP